MTVPLVDLKSQYARIKPEVDAAVQEVINSSAFILGKAVTEFENAFAHAHHIRYCIAVGSGTDALHAVLWALGITAGDEVITVPYTFIATAEAISLLGAKPVFIDIEPKTFTMDPAAIERAITSKTKALIPVHLYGQPANMDAICDIARRHKLPVIEDAAQAHLAKYNDRFVGEYGVATCFSFYPGKNLGAYGEAGAVTTNNDEIAGKLRQIRDHGQSQKYQHEFLGHNYRMDGIQGAVLGVKLKYLQGWTERRREIANMYRNLLTGVGDLVMPYESPAAYHVYHLFVLRTKQRTALQNHLSAKGISTGLHYPIPLHLQPAYYHLNYPEGRFPHSELASKECLSLPIYAEMTNEQVTQVSMSVKDFF